MGLVYAALDRESAAPVALKLLREMTADNLLRFKNEFRALQDLQHPNLVTLGELFEEGGEWFFTMELVEGVKFLDYVRRSETPAPRVELVETDTQLGADEIPTRSLGAVAAGGAGTAGADPAPPPPVARL